MAAEERFDELIHAPTRLSIVALLAATEWADFKYVRDEVGLTDSALSKQLTTLEEAGYAEVRKGFVGKRPRTTVRLTTAGRAALSSHIAALQSIITKATTRPPTPPPRSLPRVDQGTTRD